MLTCEGEGGGWIAGEAVLKLCLVFVVMEDGVEILRGEVGGGGGGRDGGGGGSGRGGTAWVTNGEGCRVGDEAKYVGIVARGISGGAQSVHVPKRRKVMVEEGLANT